LSEAGAQTMRRAHAVRPVAAVQSEYFLWARDPEAEVLSACAEPGIGFVPWSLLGQGFLTGKVDATMSFDSSDVRSWFPRFTAEARKARTRAHVAVADISEPSLRETARLIEEHGGRAFGVRCDVTRAEEVKGALDRTIEAFGRLDFAFNNAGVEQPLKPAADLIEEEWDRSSKSTSVACSFA
jgi:hypothetical protein